MRITRGLGRLVKGLLYVVMSIVLLLAALYSPLLQQVYFPGILHLISDPDGMVITAERLRLRFPLSLQVSDLRVFDRGDTMLLAGRADMKVRLMPLLSGRIESRGIYLDDVFMKLGNPDSVMYLRARVSTAQLDQPVVRLSQTQVDLERLMLDGGTVRMAMRTDTMPPTPSEPNTWRINAKLISVTDVDYVMTMDYDIDTLAVKAHALTVADGRIDMSTQHMAIGDVSLDSVDLRMITLPPDPTAPVPPAVPDSLASPPWDIDIDHIGVYRSRVLYALKGSQPLPGLDPDYLQLSHINIDVDSVAYHDGSDIAAHITHLALDERCGLSLLARGYVAMTDSGISANRLNISTAASHLDVDAYYSLDTIRDPGRFAVKASGAIAPSDIVLADPSLASTLSLLPKGVNLDAEVDADGTLSDININRLALAMTGLWDISASGHYADMSATGAEGLDAMSARLDITGNIIKPRTIERMLGMDFVASGINVPRLHLLGTVSIDRGRLAGNLTARANNGDLALKASWNNHVDGYSLNLVTDRFPVASIMPDLGVGDVTAHVTANGRGLAFDKASTTLKADVDIASIDYNNHTINDITLAAKIADRQADVAIKADDPLARLDLKADGNLGGDTLRWTFDAHMQAFNPDALGLADSIYNVAGSIRGNFMMVPDRPDMAANVHLDLLDVVMADERIKASDIDAAFATDKDATHARLTNNDLRMTFNAGVGLDELTERFSATVGTAMAMIDHRFIDIMPLQRALPRFTLSVDAGTNNMLHDYLANTGPNINRLRLNASNDSLINMTVQAEGIIMGETRIDNAALSLNQRAKYLSYRATIDNRPGTFDDFAHVIVSGYVGDDRINMIFKQMDINDDIGYHLGAVVQLADSTVTVNLVPYSPTIAYKKWTINSDNFVRLNLAQRRIDANLEMQGNGSRLHLFTHEAPPGEGDSVPTNIISLDIDSLHLTDWIAVNPFAPPMKGDLSARLNANLQPNNISADGTATLSDFYYNKKRVGTFDLELGVDTDLAGKLSGKADLLIDSINVVSLSGHMNDSTAVNPVDVYLQVNRFPLSIANPFLAPSAVIDGYLNGDMRVDGSLAKPRLNGYIDFENARARVQMIGSTFRISENRIPVNESVIEFNDFGVTGLNKNKLTVNGTIDLRKLPDFGVDLRLNADNMQIVGANKRRGVDVYGRAYISLDAHARGTSRFIAANARLSIDEGTNVTYILPDATSELAYTNYDDMITFVNFADTTTVVADTIVAPSMAIQLDAQLIINQGSTISVDLSADGSNKVQLQSNGSIDYSLSPMGDSRFVGRINIPSGFVRYTPPLMSEKLFNFNEGSYVSFNGEIDNPQINITATDRIHANVTQEGQNSRLIYFDVILKAIGSLSDLDVSFDLQTDDDITVENELQSMTPTQRANQAMNLLLYNMYTGPGTKGNASLTGNPLYAFLESTLNSWMANNIHGVDISFGIDQYQRTFDGAQSTTTSYSYQVSKTLFDDRFKIVVGGNYSTDANMDENFSQNLINDISFEYMLNKRGTMYVRLFRHTGYESILEGEVTQTGIGFVYRRKLRTLRDIFSPFTTLLRPVGSLLLPAPDTKPKQESPTEAPTPEPASAIVKPQQTTTEP